jgi:hypothetical protein
MVYLVSAQRAFCKVCALLGTACSSVLPGLVGIGDLNDCYSSLLAVHVGDGDLNSRVSFSLPSLFGIADIKTCLLFIVWSCWHSQRLLEPLTAWSY